MHNIKNHLQSIVAAKIPDAFVTKKSEITEVTATGIPQVDALIQGLPHGALTEIYGPASSGRTTLALSFLAEMTRQQQVCTIVDASDSFDPESLAAAGAHLNRVLWVRCGNADTGEDPTSACTSVSLPDFRQEAFHRPQTLTSGRHPRDEVRGMSQAISGLMKNNFNNPPGASRDEGVGQHFRENNTTHNRITIARRAGGHRSPAPSPWKRCPGQTTGKGKNNHLREYRHPCLGILWTNGRIPGHDWNKH